MSTAGIVTYSRGPEGTLAGQWTHADLGGQLATERAWGGTPGTLESSYRVEIDAAGGQRLFEGTLTIARAGQAYGLTWSGHRLLPERAPARYTGIGVTGPGDTLVATFQEDQSPSRATLREVSDRIPGANGERFADAFRHGTLRVLLYAPRKTDPQEPHDQDEVYLVMKGSGTFVLAGVRRPFAEGDVLFVPATVAHRFEEFTDDLAVWVVFYGPAGGEVQGNPRPEIERANADFATAFGRGDAEAVARMYTEDGKLFPPNSPIVAGRAAIARFWKAAMGAGIKRVTLETAEVASLGVTAAETGVARLFGDNNVVLDDGKYVVIWQRIEGRWKLHRDCWNSSRQPQT
jgi:ketosteroid isomerase-like protein/mannose-6-phosphate isomerase-like protein (cupin superfamily)